MPPSAPKNAATVVVLAGEAHDLPRVVMIRRSTKSRFMPSTHVFPGGRVEPSDGTGDEAFAAAAARECLEEVGLSLAPTELHWFDTWTTPSAEPRRYHARFFAAFVAPERIEGLSACERETFDLTRRTARGMLDAWAAGEADLPPPTLGTLLRLADRTVAEIRAMIEAVDPAPPILPKWIERDGIHHVRLPHAPDYDRLPGEGAPAPARIADLPHGFARKEGRWHPEA